MKNKHKNAIPTTAFTILLLSVVMLSACSTAAFVKNEKNIRKTTTLVYEKEAEKLAELSNTPFLFDTEILVREDDITTLWNNLSASGFRLPEATVTSAETVDFNSWQAFSRDSIEVKSYFRNYVSEKAALVKLTSAQGTYLLVLDGKKGIYPKISALRGPLDE